MSGANGRRAAKAMNEESGMDAAFGRGQVFRT